MTFDKVLIANRGEIARRVARTCRDMGLVTVAVFSDADAAAAHVRDADEAVHIGPAPSADSYLAIDRVIAAARRTGAGAVHPGYGFLAENAAFAKACADAGLVFVGPGPEAIAAMGSKIGAKALMAEHGVPVIPGFDGGDQSDAAFLAAAPDVGYPLLVKASAGGGGKGMRTVRAPEALPAALAAARREARAAFGDDRLLIERYVERPRHVEVQILGDAYGNVIHLLERECSIQRRHQKIIEETPSPALDDALRAAMGAAAVEAGRAIGYRSAGTVEFILAPDGAFYFLEVNTRLQVEHPVTELVTGLDLVRLQLEVAMGRPLPLTQGDVAARGHAIECRVYAENPAEGFLPQTGRLVDWDVPETLPGIRLDSGVEAGDDVCIHYDPMLAKLIAWGRDRDEATRRLIRALSEASIQGVRTNRRFLIDVLRDDAWASGDVSTHLIDERFSGWTDAGVPDEVVRVAMLAATADELGRLEARERPLPSLAIGWRNSPLRDPVVSWRRGDAGLEVAWRHAPGGGYVMTAAGAVHAVTVEALGAGELRVGVDGHLQRIRLVADGARRYVHVAGWDVVLDRAPRFPDVDHKEAGGGCRAPMTGKVLEIRVAEGDQVEAGQVLLVLEAMKMEHPLQAPGAGRVEALLVEAGEVVDADQELVRLAEPPQ